MIKWLTCAASDVLDFVESRWRLLASEAAALTFIDSLT
jgi:hypothetical protein